MTPMESHALRSALKVADNLRPDESLAPGYARILAQYARLTAADLARVRREAFEEAARVAETPTGYWQVGTKRTPYWDGAKVAAKLRSLASTPEAP